MKPPWFVSAATRPKAEVVLLCLPFAGGGAEAYRAWGRGFPDWVEVLAVQLPGRDSRRSEPGFRRMPPLVYAVMKAALADSTRPFALFGHGMGALVAFEWARASRRAAIPGPVALLVSGSAPPRHARARARERADCYCDRLVTAMAVSPSGTERSGDCAPNSAERAAICEADLELVTRYEYRWEPPLRQPLFVFGGRDDEEAPPALLSGWREEASDGYAEQIVPGGHFDLLDQGDMLLAHVLRVLEWTRRQPFGRVTVSAQPVVSSLSVPAWQYVEPDPRPGRLEAAARGADRAPAETATSEPEPEPGSGSE